MPEASPSVLAVDDNATIRKAISLRLGAKGYDVVTAPDGPEALELIRHRAFDLMLLDLRMPGMGGDEVLRQVRRRYDAIELPIIMLAASDDRNDINHSLELGANDYVTKPGDLPVLLARIKTQLNLKRTAEKKRQPGAAVAAVKPGAEDPDETRPDGGAPRIVQEDAVEIKYHVLYDNMPMTCFTLNCDGEIQMANRYGAQYLGYQRDELEHTSILELYADEDRGLAQEYLASVVDLPGRMHRWDIRRLKKNGVPIWMRETARAIGDGADMLILMTCEDIDDTHKLTEQLCHQATHDELTGLVNRKTIEERLAQVIDSARTEHTEHALALLDLDQFKIINKTSGHLAGDDLLRQVARLLKDVVRKRDTLARVGSDEFAVLIEDSTLAEAREAVKAMKNAIETYRFTWGSDHHRLSVSIGIVPLDARCENTTGVLMMADTACYAARESGGERIHVYHADDEMVTTMNGEMRRATQINDALLNDRFELSFQRIAPIDGSENQGDHYELLVRMRDPHGNLVMPGTFLPTAERYNLSDKIDRWVVTNAFQWLHANPVLLQRLHLCAINLSGRSMGDESILEFILNRIAEYQIPPNKLCFEVTETAAISNLARATRFICVLKEHGCHFALDDFGCGFSSLAYLKALPVDFLKIDGSFVRDMLHDSIDHAMVRSINDIGHVMGKKTIAEFVENEGTLQALRNLGVDYAQGYGIGKPLPLSAL